MRKTKVKQLRRDYLALRGRSATKGEFRVVKKAYNKLNSKERAGKIKPSQIKKK